MTLNEGITELTARLAGDDDLRASLGCTFAIRVDGHGRWRFKCRDKFEVAEGQHSADVTLISSSEDFIKLLQGALNPQEAFLERRIRLEGDYGCTLNLYSLFDGSLGSGTK